PRLRIADGVKNGGGGLGQIGGRGSFVEQWGNAVRETGDQRHFDKYQRLMRQTRVKESVAAAVAIEAVFQVGPAADVVHRFVLDELFQQRRGRIPGQPAQLQKTDIEPGGKKLLQLGIERQQARVAFKLAQQFGAQVQQKPHAVRKHGK